MCYQCDDYINCRCSCRYEDSADSYCKECEHLLYPDLDDDEEGSE